MTTLVKSQGFNATTSSNAIFNPIAFLVRANAKYRMHQKMRSLSDEALDDMGLSRSEIEREISRKSWNAPAHWRA